MAPLSVYPTLQSHAGALTLPVIQVRQLSAVPSQVAHLQSHGEQPGYPG